MQFGQTHAYCKNANRKWYCYNDKNVSLLDEFNVKTNNSYVLFYRKKRNILINWKKYMIYLYMSNRNKFQPTDAAFVFIVSLLAIIFIIVSYFMLSY